MGRLDKASEGLVLLTNDSEWAARITSPASHLDKKYHVQVDCVADADLLAKITRGCAVAGGSTEHLRAKGARLLRHGDKNSWIEITLDEGRNRQIRRLLEALEVRVLRLVRVSIGPIELGDLTKGSTRRLTAAEKRDIDRALARENSSLGCPIGESRHTADRWDEATKPLASFAAWTDEGVRPYVSFAWRQILKRALFF